MSMESLEKSVKALQQLLIEENKRKNELEKEVRALKTRLDSLEDFVQNKFGSLPGECLMEMSYFIKVLIF